MTGRATTTEVVVEEVSREEGARLFDARARELLGISGAEFIAAYEGGYAWSADQADAVTELTMLLPFAR
jgi:hypothetical protein